MIFVIKNIRDRSRFLVKLISSCITKCNSYTVAKESSVVNLSLINELNEISSFKQLRFQNSKECGSKS